jgi:hypothetical protein
MTVNRDERSGTDSLWHISGAFGPLSISVGIPYRPGLIADIIRAEIADPLTLLLQKVLHTTDFVGGTPSSVPRRDRTPKVVDVDRLRARLGPATRPPRQPEPVRVTGVFSPAVLLNAGWWERARGGPDPVGRNGIQQWTYAGFEEWAPSWDFTSEDGPDRSRFFLGQLGRGDEANSILVAAVGEKGRAIRNGIMPMFREQGVGALKAEVTALLCHRSHLMARNPALGAAAARWQGEFDYCLLLDSEQHRIDPLREIPDYYSAYVWQCWWATQDAPMDEPPRLRDCYLLWEHTDLTNVDAIRYNLDSLAHKAAYVRDRYGPLELLQKSGFLVPGRPVLGSPDFQRLLGAIGEDDRR